jgi:hypothetical protein
MPLNHLQLTAIDHLAPDRQAFCQWCESHQTSVEIGFAILVLAGDAPDAERLWHNPNRGEQETILMIARELVGKLAAGERPSSLCWGGNTY